jgi:hypothetical protein
MRTREEACELQPKLRAKQKTDRPLAIAQNARSPSRSRTQSPWTPISTAQVKTSAG